MAAAIVQGNFKVCIEKIFNSWSVLQLAVHQGFGGQHTAEKATWFVDVTDQWFKDNKNLDPYEVEDFLAEILNNEFDTIADDGSLSYVAASLCKSHTLAQRGQTTELEALLSKLPAPSVDSCVRGGEGEEEESEEEEEEDVMDTSEQDAPSGAGNTQTENPADAENQADASREETEESDGWTVIKRGKKR